MIEIIDGFLRIGGLIFANIITARQLASDVFDWLKSVFGIWLFECTPDGGLNYNSNVWLKIQKDGYCIARQTDLPSNASQAPLNAQELEHFLFEAPINRALMIEVGQGLYLKRRLANKALPFGRAKVMAQLDMEQNVPFLRDETYILLTKAGPGKEMSYYIVRRSILDPIIEIVDRSKHRISAIRMVSDEGNGEISGASLGFVLRESNSQIRKTTLTSWVTGAVLVLLLATFAHAYFRNESALDSLDRLIADKQAQAIDFRRKLDKRQGETQLLQAVRRAKSEAVPVTLIWEELTQRLPDGTWLTDLSIRNDQVTIGGFSNSAADLIAAFEASPYLKMPNFTSPVMRVPGQQGERFTIELRTKRP